MYLRGAFALQSFKDIFNVKYKIPIFSRRISIRKLSIASSNAISKKVAADLGILDAPNLLQLEPLWERNPAVTCRDSEEGRADEASQAFCDEVRLHNVVERLEPKLPISREASAVGLRRGRPGAPPPWLLRCLHGEQGKSRLLGLDDLIVAPIASAVEQHQAAAGSPVDLNKHGERVFSDQNTLKCTTEYLKRS